MPSNIHRGFPTLQPLRYALVLALVLVVPAALLGGTPSFAKPQPAKGEMERLLRIDQEVDGYPVLIDPKGKAQLLRHSLDIKETQLTPAQEQQITFLRDYAYLSFLVESEQNEQAEKLFAKQPDRSKWPPNLSLLEARMLLENKRLDAARRRCQDVIAAYPQTVEAYVLLSRINGEDGKTSAAIETLESARKIAPKNAEVLEHLGRFYNEQMRKATTREGRTKAMGRLEGVFEDIVKAVPGRSSVPYLYVLAYIKQEENKPKEAIEYLDRLIHLDPRRTDARLQMAHFQKSLGDKEGALETLKQAFLFDPDQTETAGALDQMLRDSGRAPLRFYKALAEEYPGRDPIQIHYARILVTNGQADEAVRVLKATLDLHPHNETAWLMLAGVYYRQHKASEGRAAVNQYLAFSPKDADAMAKVVRLLLTLGAKDDAGEYLGKLRALQPDSPELTHLLVQGYLAKQDYEKALAELRKAIATRPDDVGNYLLLVRTLVRLRRLGEAAEPLKKALAAMTGEQHDLIAAELAQVYEKTGRYDDALAILKQAIAKQPRNARWQLALARLHKARKETDKAREVLAQVAKTHSRNADVLHDTGAAYWEMGFYDEGEALIRQAIQLDPSSADYYNTLGYLLSERKIRLDEALQLVQKALQLQPDAGYIIDSLGWVYFQKGELDKAVKTLEQAAEMEQEDATVQSHLGLAYLKLGRKADALEHLKAALEFSEDEAESAKLKEEIRKIERK